MSVRRYKRFLPAPALAGGWAQPVSMIAVLLAVVSVAVSAWLIFASSRFAASDVSMPVAVEQRLDASEQRLAQAVAQVQQARDQATQAAAAAQQTSEAARNAAAQRDEVTRLYERLVSQSRNATLTDVVNTIDIAQAQLVAGGSAGAALLILQPVHEEIDALNSAALSPVAIALAADINALEQAAATPLAQQLQTLDDLIAASTQLPLRGVANSPQGPPQSGVAPAPDVSAAPAEQSAAEEDPATGWWARLQRKSGELVDLGDAGEKLKDMVRVTTVDGADTSLLGPLQAELIRANLRTSLLNARLALLARHTALLKAELSRADAWLGAHFDAQALTVDQARRQLRQLSATGFPVPTLSRSAAAARNALKASGLRSERSQASDASRRGAPPK